MSFKELQGKKAIYKSKYGAKYEFEIKHVQIIKNWNVEDKTYSIKPYIIGTNNVRYNIEEVHFSYEYSNLKFIDQCVVHKLTLENNYYKSTKNT